MVASAQNRVTRRRDVDNIPVISIERLDGRATLAALDAACREWGFFQVVDHGIYGGVIDALQREMKGFFAQSSDVKRTISRTAENPWGFYDRELTKNTRDWKEIYDYGPPDGNAMRPQWPSARPAFRPTVEAFYRECESLALRLLAALARNLGMPPDALDGAFVPAHTSYLRLNYYPRCPAPARTAGLAIPTTGHLGINHHTDAGALTLLLQDAQPGLEVYRDGEWHLIEPRTDALVVNIGDIVQVWSNDRYRASLHRVIASQDAERFSAPFFLNPAYGAWYAPLPTTVDRDHPPAYRPINWGEFRALRAAGDYADCGEEVQIHRYRLRPKEQSPWHS
jgi:isopenicillin N synthase-like dioxygenase